MSATFVQTPPTLKFPSGLTLDRSGSIIVADRGAHAVFRIDSRTGDVTTIVGTGTAGFAGDGAEARNALVRNPEWVEFDARGNLYLADRGNHRVRKVDPSGIISAVAGNGELAHSGDGRAALQAAITNPFGLTLDREGNLFIFDTESHSIRRVDARTGVITTVIGTTRQGFGGDGGPATQALLYRPHNGVFDREGRLVFGDSFNQRIRRWDPATGIITTIAGIGEQGSSPAGTPAMEARFTYFGAMAYDRDGSLVFTSLDHRILAIDAASGRLRVLAGTGTAGFSGDDGPATQAQVNTPYGLAIAPNGDLIFADAGNGRVRRIDARTGVIRTIAGGR